MPFLGFRWVVNFVLLAVPIGVTLGVLMGLDAGRSANGEKPLFTEPDNPGTIPKNNGITPMVSCDKAMGLHPLSKGQEYTRKPSPPFLSLSLPSRPCFRLAFSSASRFARMGGTDREDHTMQGGQSLLPLGGGRGGCSRTPVI